MGKFGAVSYTHLDVYKRQGEHRLDPRPVTHVLADWGPAVLVADLRERQMIDATITAGHAFGGDLEAVTVHSALTLSLIHI